MRAVQQMITLTAQQKKLLTMIEEWIGRYGTAPTYQQMADALGLASKSGVHRLLIGLEERGAIARLPYRHGSVKVVLCRGQAQTDAMTKALVSSQTYLLRHRKAMMKQFCGYADYDRSVLSGTEARLVQTVDQIIDQIAAALTVGCGQ
ncbi:MAG: hypothetical protein DI498_10890 [Paracoccus denitrificans]|nr:MAG: hypothetical protein DI498_10890 [Paracoccus denitrificans]PZO83648.1 MAG: hypothetical protein DI633_10890 [Paracoccus denitrificans]